MTVEPSSRASLRSLCAAACAVLAFGAQAGCSREFFREWANQDASGAVFEKSRDPRWRLDLFSVDPPAMSRFADPSDPDVPAAPPDDYAAQSLSPVPQVPNERLIVPLEGTGYIDMLEDWQRQRSAPKATPRPGGGPLGSLLERDKPAQTPKPAQPALPPPASRPGPFEPPPKPNSGTDGAATTPMPLSVGPETGLPRAHAQRDRTRDLAVRLAAFQETGLPLPVPPPAPDTPVATAPGAPAGDLKTPPVGMDPDPINQDLAQPVNPRPDLSPEQYKASEAIGAEMSGLLVSGALDFDESEAAGLPRNSQPYVVNLDQAFKLSLINARVYQFQLEQVYLMSLAVTLQRFAFQPQLYAGFNPLTSPLSGPTALGGASGGFANGLNPANRFFYSTRETGAPASTLTLGTVAGVGKVFSSGGKLLAGFANQVVFNFIGKNSAQPQVQSFLPISFVQPFLRGGGRAVTLEPLTQAERNLLYQVRTFAQFRQQFTVAVLVGGSIPNFGTTVASLGFSAGGSSDSVVGYINVLEDLQIVENDRRNIAAFEQLLKVFSALKEGASSGLSQLQVDQVDSSLQGARQRFILDRLTYRNDLDGFKQQIGLPPDVPMVLDRTLTLSFKKVFDEIEEWGARPKRELSDLPKIVDKLPELEDVVLDGRSVLAVYNQGKDNEDTLEELLLAGERLALEHRLDLMNQRAALYDAWRQIRVTANALKGVLNVAVTNQFLTPPTTTNPFAFVDQAKQFSLVFNAELPLVRMSERNTFRAALINYQRSRRTLQNNEDSIKLLIRQDIRNMHQQYLNYQITQRNFILQVRLKDQAFEQIVAPPAGGAGAAANANAAIQTQNLTQAQSALIQTENALVAAWQLYQQQRLALYRDLGTLPYDEWEAYHELFPSGYDNNSTSAARPDAKPAGASAPAADRTAAPRP